MKKLKGVVFTSELKTISDKRFTVDEHQIRDEPMLFSSSVGFARNNGGDLTQNILDRLFMNDLEADVFKHGLMGYHPVIDTRVMMLNKGQYPCIPGWHCDDVPRDKTSQPNLERLREDISHYVSYISSVDNLCPTEVMRGRTTVNEVDPRNVWKSVDKAVSGLNEAYPGRLATTINSGEVVRFSRSTLHKGTPAHTSGWRFFFRLSFMETPAKNEIRQQVQVYADINQGW